MGVTNSNTVRDGAVLDFDFANIKSYIGSGEVVFSVPNKENGTILNTVDPVAWGATYSVFDEKSPTSIHFVNSAGGSYFGFRLLNKNCISWTVFEVSLTLEVVSGVMTLYMGSAGGGYEEGPSAWYGVGTHIIQNKSFYVANYYGGLHTNLEFSIRTGSVNGEARITNLNVTQRVNSGVLVNTPIFSATNMRSIIFDGTNDYIEVPNYTFDSVAANGNYSYNVWVYSHSMV